MCLCVCARVCVLFLQNWGGVRSSLLRILKHKRLRPASGQHSVADGRNVPCGAQKSLARLGKKQGATW